jgi:hypothetical protein
VAGRGVIGTEVAASAGADQAIAPLATGITAFVGRTLKGPVNEPVAVRSFAEFQQTFGGLWQPAPLAYAVQQYFDNGGAAALIVRVANGARPPTLSLPTPRGPLRLVGVNPGSREYLRAAVDYDGIPASEPDRFNLVIQRVRSLGSELIEEQEIQRRVSFEQGSARFLTDVLLESRLVRVLGVVPDARPERTLGQPGGPAVGYVHCTPDGTDGAALSDYDVIGSATKSTGLFALGAAPFELLYIPPLSREQDLGMSTLLVAGRFCRERHALLIVDPPAEWDSPDAALGGLRHWPFRSEDAAMFFPRVLAFDRLRNRVETFGSGAAAAALLTRDATPPWVASGVEDALLRPGSRPAFPVEEGERARLAQAGVNTLQALRAARSRVPARTLAAAAGAPPWKYLAARRLALAVVAAIERGTRWLAFTPNTQASWIRAQAQVTQFFVELEAAGAFAARAGQEAYFVVCDERVNRAHTVAAGKVNLLFGFATAKDADFQGWLVTHAALGSHSRPVALNRLATARQRVAWEIESSIRNS